MKSTPTCQNCQKIIEDVISVKEVVGHDWLITGRGLRNRPNILIDQGDRFLVDGHLMVRYKKVDGQISRRAIESGNLHVESEWTVGSLCRIF